MVVEDRDSAYSARRDRLLELTRFIRRVDEKIKNLLNDVSAEGNDEMVHDAKTLKSYQRSLKHQLYHNVSNMIVYNINRVEDKAIVIVDCDEALAFIEAMVCWFTKVEGMIDARVNKLRELLEERIKNSKNIIELSSNFNQSIEGGLESSSKDIEVGDIEVCMQNLILQLINRSVCTNLGLLTITEEDWIDDAGDLDLATVIKEALMAPVANIEGQLSLLVLQIIVLLSMCRIKMPKFQEFKSSLESVAQNSCAKIAKRILDLVIRATHVVDMMLVRVPQTQQGQPGIIMEDHCRIVEAVLDYFVVEIFKLESFMNYVDKLELQSLSDGAVIALSKNTKPVEDGFKALEQRISKLKTLLKFNDFDSTVNALADACKIDLKK